jgi:CDP-diglyceride synthetase
MALFLIVGQAHFVINNIFEGMIWFFLPVAMVITNDIFAYICGITFGRTPLIKISPKKTWEGFLGAWFFTIIFGILFTNIMARYSYFICPVNVRMFLLSSSPPLTIAGSRRKHLDWFRVQAKPGLHSTPIHTPDPSP